VNGPLNRRALRGFKKDEGSPRVPNEAPDSLRSRAFARVLDLLSEGEIEGLVNGLRSVYLDETPIQNPDGSYNFTGVTLETRNGTQGQTYIPGFSSVENEVSVGAEVVNAAPLVRSITDANVDAARVRISFPALYSINAENGDTSGTTVQYVIDLQSNGGGFVPQVLGAAYVPSTLSYPEAVTINATTALRGQVTWTKPTEQDGDGRYEQTSFQVHIEYQLASGGAWSNLAIIQSGAAANGGTETYGFEITGLAENNYRVRAVKTLGNGIFHISFLEELQPATTITVSGKSTGKYEKTHRVELTGSAPWDIRVRRLTADSGSTLLQNRTVWESYTQIVDTKLRYPNSALAALVIDSSQFQAIPRRGYDCKLLRIRVPSNYDPVTREYTGTWDGTFQVAWSDNPAWCFYDLVTSSRYGLGEFVDTAQVDKWSLYAIGRYCDEMVHNGQGALEPRFTCNLYMQTRDDAYRVVNNLASVFRGMVYWSAGAITCVQDSPSDAAQLYTAANVIDGEFIYSGSSRRMRHTVALVTWNDPDDFYRQKVEYVEDQDGIALYGVVQTEVVAVGCTSRGQAHRVGRWILYTERLEGESVTFKLGLDGNLCRPGQVINIADPNRAGVRRGGRVMTGSTASSILLDSSVVLGAGAYTLLVMEPDGTVQESTVTTGAGTHTTLAVSPAFPNAPQAHALWMLRDSVVEPQTFRVVSVVENERHQFEVTALAHNASKFDAVEDGLQLEALQTTTLRGIPDAPEDLDVAETLYEYQAELRVLVSFSWSPVPEALTYELWWRRNGGNWTVVRDLGTPEYEVRDAQVGDYDMRVYAVNGSGVRSAVSEHSETVLGKVAPPADVQTFGATQNNNVVVFKWSQVLDVDLAGYELRYILRSEADVLTDSGWDNAAPLTSVTKGTQVTTAAIPPGDWAFLIKAVDTSKSAENPAGVYSATARRYDLEVVTPFTLIDEQDHHPAWRDWDVASHTPLWSEDPAALMWGITPLMWAANPATLMWGAATNFMWEQGESMWTPSRMVRHWTGVLVPQSQDLASAGGWDTFDEFVPNPYPLAYYDAPEIDQLFDAAARLWANIGATLGPGETTGVADPEFFVDYRAEADQYNGPELWTIGEFTGRYVLPRLRVDTSRGLPRINEFTVTLDADENSQGAKEVAVGASGEAIVFNPQFHSTPRLQISAKSAAGAARFATWESLTPAGFTARVFDAAGTETGGTVNWDALGV
jgi:predicted phage tail protein